VLKHSTHGGLAACLTVAGVMTVLAPAAVAERDRPCPLGRFPASGQTTPRPADINDGIPDNPVAVPDDGTLQTGATLRYIDNGDGTITDRNTRLMWEKKDDDGGLHSLDNVYPWSGGVGDTVWDWLADVNAEGGTGFAGYDDWRLPSVKELLSIIDYEDPTGPTVRPEFHTNCAGSTVLTGSCTAPNRYWSSTTMADIPAAAWAVNFNSGGVDPWDKGAFTRHVRAVRRGCQ
jgi:Protein of unknown function (DUF1566)